MITYSDSDLLITINNLTGKEKAALRGKLRPDIIKRVFDHIRETIASEAKQRIQSKIVLTFIHGYGTGALFNSIYTKIEGNKIIVSSTKNYFAILNAGFRSYDMKVALAGKRVKMRLPGGRIIYRIVPDQVTPNFKRQSRSKRQYARGNWIHPGWRGVHIYEQVEKEMEQWVKTYVREQVESLLHMASAGQSSYDMTDAGKIYYNQRNNSGQFTVNKNLSNTKKRSKK